MTKVCYFIQSYKQFEQILRLVTTLRRLSPNAVIILSHSLKGCPLDESSLKDQGVHIRYAEGGRGTFSLTKAYLDAIEWLVSNKIEFDWFINLTAQDYPIKPKGYIEEVLSTTEYDGFLEYFHVLSSECPWPREEIESRYFYQYHPLVKELSSYQKKLFAPLKLINKVQPYFRIRNDFDLRLGIFRGQIFHENFRCYGGSYFTVLSRKCVEYIQAFMISNPDIINYFKRVCFPDESLVQTILINGDSFRLMNRTMHYFDFYENNQDGHPKVFGTDDYPEIIQQSCFFARKFDISKNGNVLDLIDVNILYR